MMPKSIMFLSAFGIVAGVDRVWSIPNIIVAAALMLIVGAVIDYFGTLMAGGASGSPPSNTAAMFGDGSGVETIILDGGAGSNRLFRYASGGSNRWSFYADSTAEGGSDAGSDFVIASHDDAGTVLGNVLKLMRSSMQVLFANGTALLPGLAPIGDPDTGFRFAAANPGVLRFSSGGVEKLLFSDTGISTSGSATRLGTSAYVQLNEASSTPGAPTVDAQANIYCKGDKFIIQFNDGSTVRYKYLDMTGTGVTWVHTTTPP